MTSGKSNIYIRLDVSIVLKKIYVLHKNFYRTQTTHEEEKINPFSIFSLLLYYCILTLLNWIELNWIDVLVANWLLKLKHKIRTLVEDLERTNNWGLNSTTPRYVRHNPNNFGSRDDWIHSWIKRQAKEEFSSHTHVAGHWWLLVLFRLIQRCGVIFFSLDWTVVLPTKKKIVSSIRWFLFRYNGI